jgi:peptide/nickel transport system permease protein
VIAYAARRLAGAVPIVALATLIVFFLVSAMGDPLAEARHRPRVSAETLERRAEQLHLDRSRPAQYGLWLGDFMRGDWGESFSTGRPVRGSIMTAAWNTALLVLPAAVISVVVALAAGTFAARRRGRLGDHAVNGLTSFGVSMPEFWFALVLQLVLVVWLQQWFGLDLFAIRGKYSPGREGELLDLLRHMVLPVAALSITNVAIWTRFHRDSMIDALESDTLTTARAAGVSEHRVVYRHALRNSAGPFVTIVALDVGLLLGGVVVVERVFAWPGLGFLFFNAVNARDYPMILAWMTLAAIFVVIANVVGDIVAAALDPRVQLR